MKRLALSAFALLLVGLLSACSPKITVENYVLPTLYSVTVPEARDGAIVLQGRYFGDGYNGQTDTSYVILGADVNGLEGIAVRPAVWTPSRIEVGIPEGAGSGFVFVVVDGLRSNGLPASLP